MRNWLVLLLLAAPSLMAADQEYLIQRSYFHARRLYGSYPPDTHYLLNLGTCTNGVSTALINLLPPDISDSYLSVIPLEHLFALVAVGRDTNLIWDRLIPDESTLQGRRLVIHRILDQGLSMQRIYRSLVSFLEKHRPLTEFSFDLVGRTFPSSIEFFPFSPWGFHRSRLYHDAAYARGVTSRSTDRHASEAIQSAGPYLPFHPEDVEREDFSFTPNPHFPRFRALFRDLERKIRVPHFACTWPVAAGFPP